MSSLLPVLRDNHPAMSLCAWCPEPGHCCKDFFLQSSNGGERDSNGRYIYGSNFCFWKGDRDGRLARQDAERELFRRGLPYSVADIAREGRTKRGHSWVMFSFNCPKLGADGRCQIYATRPDICRRYLPGQDALCLVKKAV
jgi:Fe-S-cluster containining protein